MSLELQLAEKAAANVDEGCESGKLAKACIKCASVAVVSVGGDRAQYCRSCFIDMITHRVRSTFGKHGVFRQTDPSDDHKRALLVCAPLCLA
jgi:hypothetical protein